MNLSKLFRNPEVKKVTIKFIIILILTLVTMLFLSYKLTNKINRIILNSNEVFLSNVLNGEELTKASKNLYEINSEDDLIKAKNFLSAYGYDENLSFGSNGIKKEILIEILIIFLPLASMSLVILYVIFIKELKGVYNKIDKIVVEANSMHNGKFNKIENEYEEGEIAILISSLNFMGDRVNNSIDLLKKEKEYSKDFLSDISHQLKTPLASLIMFNDLLRENENMSYEDRVKFLDKCDEQLSRMEWLIMNLLKVGRLDAGAIKFNFSEKPINETLELAVSSLKEKAEIKNQSLIISGDLGISLYHDKKWLAEAISNIIKNAIDHTDENGRIEVRVEKGKLVNKIYISDNGHGIPKDMQKKIFKRFYKGVNSINPKSVGIGLSLSKSIVEEHNGEIKIISEEGKGSTFIISLLSLNT